MAAFVLAFAGYAAAQTTEGNTTAKATTESISTVSKEEPKKVKPQKISRKERKALAAQEAAKSVKITVPLPDVSKNTFPKMEDE